VTFIAAIDQGTTSSRCIVFDADGRIVASDQREHRQMFPRPGWVEHDPSEIWHNVQSCVANALSRAGIAASDLAAIGITNQRETTVLWDRRTGHPVHPAIVWQDTRTDELAAQLAGEAGTNRFRDRTGLPLATYFSGPKVRWLLDADPSLRARAEAGEILFGTMDTWLIWNLTGHHITDVTNASRTMLMSLSTVDWDDELCEALGVPRAMLPQIQPSSTVYGHARGPLHGVPVAGALGDQQAALFGQVCFDPGDAKCTYGTGAFLLQNTGTTPTASSAGLITTVAYQLQGQAPVYALEGSIAVAGSLVQWPARQPGPHRHGVRHGRSGGIGARQWRGRDRTGVLRSLRATLAVRRPGCHRRPDRVRDQGAPRAGRARRGRLAGPGGGRRDGAGRQTRTR
jgi:glycerol kinase